VAFTKSTETISHNDAVVLQGQRTPATKLWELDIQPHPSASANAAIGSATTADMVAFAHGTLFSPVLSTLEEALWWGHVPKFAGLTLETLCQHPPRSIAMLKGHLDQTRQNVCSTKSCPSPDTHAPIDPNDDAFPPGQPTNKRTHLCFAAVLEPTGQTHMDLTGKFPVQSLSGNNYILVVYDYDSNGILTVPLPNRCTKSILAAYQIAHACLCAAGLCPKLQCLDNEALQALKDFLVAEDVDYQLVPPHIHCRNAAERAIRTFKNHFIAGLCSTDKNFPLNLWDKLLPQAELTLNLLRGSQLNP